jgi:hypothetical protein
MASHKDCHQKASCNGSLRKDVLTLWLKVDHACISEELEQSRRLWKQSNGSVGHLPARVLYGAHNAASDKEVIELPAKEVKIILRLMDV